MDQFFFINPRSAISNQQSLGPPATAGGSDTLHGDRRSDVWMRLIVNQFEIFKLVVKD